jgi:hypothetical protein
MFFTPGFWGAQQNGIFYEWYRWEILLCRMTNDEGFYLAT